MKKLTILSMAIATSLATQLVFAAPSNPLTGDCVPPSLTGSSGNVSGKSGTESNSTKRQARVEKILAKFDTNQDGQITLDEVQTSMAEKFAQHAENILTKFDTNQDGQITLDEVQANHADRFTEIDTDGNGFLSVEEFKNGAPRPSSPPKDGMGPEGAPDDMPPPPPPMGEGQPGMGGCMPGGAIGDPREQHRQRHFNRVDSDGDGQISSAEFMANIPLFDKFDCDENGVITQDDLLKGPCQMPLSTGDNGSTTQSQVPPLPVFDRFDCNQDNVVTKDELAQGPCQKSQ